MCCAQVDTKDILFICGGAFIGLDRQVAERTAMSSIGFGNPVRCEPLTSFLLSIYESRSLIVTRVFSCST